jgi:hypothetical protein
VARTTAPRIDRSALMAEADRLLEQRYRALVERFPRVASIPLATYVRVNRTTAAQNLLIYGDIA